MNEIHPKLLKEATNLVNAFCKFHNPSTPPDAFDNYYDSHMVLSVTELESSQKVAIVTIWNTRDDRDDLTTLIILHDDWFSDTPRLMALTMIFDTDIQFFYNRDDLLTPAWAPQNLTTTNTEG